MIVSTVVFLFNLTNGGISKVTIKDIRSDIEDSELMALADLMIQKKLLYKGSPFVSLKSCTKTNSEITKIK
ncbi:MAG: DUF2922 family protein [Oscillospiraceae bacterium]|nr:DUF2922 family protein [Oscillospiraceae bacterium]